MDKKTFYAALSEKLAILGVSRDYIERHIRQFDGYFEGQTEEEIASDIDKLGDLDRVAARIKRMTDKMAEQEGTASRSDSVNETVPSESGAAPQKNDEPTDIKKTASESKTAASDDEIYEEVDIRKDKMSEELDHAVDQIVDDAPDNNFVIEENPDETNLKNGFDSREEYADYEEEQLSFFTPRSSDDIPSVGGYRGENDDRIVREEWDEDTFRKRLIKFRLLFVATLPITLAVLAITAVFFAVVFFAIAVLIIAVVAALVAVTALGTLVSVFGLIFGIAQMLSQLPIGLYECGLSIIFGASALFVGILLYNIAVRLLPFAGKWLWVFVKFVFRKYKELYVFLKRGVIGL